MKTSIRLMLNKTRKLKDGRYPLVIRVIHNRHKRLLYTGYRLYEEGFDETMGKVLPDGTLGLTASKIQIINREISKRKKEICERIRYLEQNNESYHIDEIIPSKEGKLKKCYLLEYIDRQIEVKMEKLKEGIAAAYRSTRSSVAKYIGGKDIPVDKVNHSFVQGYIDFLNRRHVSENTVSYYLRNLRSLYNKAIDDGLLSQYDYPFSRVSMRPAKTDKRAVTRQYMEIIAGLKLEDNPELELARDLYLFSFYSQGMSFVDIVYLKKENVRSGMIVYNRHKSKQLIRIVITPSMDQLMRKYENNSEYIFPIIDDHSPKSVYSQYRLALGRINRQMHKIETMLGIQVTITTYCARHTWATLAHDFGAPISVISSGLGHSSEKMTQVYLKELDMKILNQINMIITDLAKE